MNVDKPLNAHSLDWLRTEMRLGGDMALSVQALRDHGYSDRAILAALEAVRPRGDAVAAGALAAPPLLKNPPAGLRRLKTAAAEIYTLEGFLAPNKCARLVALIDQHLKPSTLAYNPYDDAFRTSRTAELAKLRNPAADFIDEQICRTLGIRESYSEGIQAQRYDVGQQFKPHWDWFEPGTNAYSRYAGVRGNRTWTFMVYLNEELEGGATRFPELDLAVAPRTGMALLWKNLNDDGTPNRATRHSGEPVTRGHKVIITKWFRVHGDGPVFYE